MIGYAMIVDINGFTPMVENSTMPVAQFIRDILSGGVSAVENAGGSVVGFMGDAFLAIFPEKGDVISACFSIARDCDKQAEWISSINSKSSGAFPLEKGPSLKIGIEFGNIDISDISSNYLGNQKLHIGRPINYASRILSPGTGNRCHIGKAAFENLFERYGNVHGPFETEGKHEAESPYIYYLFEMGEIWREGEIDEDGESFWG